MCFGFPTFQASQLTTPKTKLATKLVQAIKTNPSTPKLRTNMPRVCLVFEGEELAEAGVPEEYDEEYGSFLLSKSNTRSLVNTKPILQNSQGFCVVLVPRQFEL